MSSEKAKDKSPDIDAQLNEAAKAFDVDSCKRLINDGADANKVFHEANSNAWYAGDSSSILFNAIRAFQPSDVNQANYVETVVLLLKNGANANFSAQVGNWNRSTHYPVFKKAIQTISSLSSMQLKKKLLLAFVETGVELNAGVRRGKQGHFSGCGSMTYPIFDLVKEAGKSGELDLVALYLDCGVNVNLAKWSWEEEFADEDEARIYSKSRETLLHCAIQTQNVALVQMLIKRGAQINENMIWTYENED